MDAVAGKFRVPATGTIDRCASHATSRESLFVVAGDGGSIGADSGRIFRTD